jgi:arabinose-5-phosphate isomerase
MSTFIKNSQNNFLNKVLTDFKSISSSVCSIENILDQNFEDFVQNLNLTRGRIVFCSIGKSYLISKQISAMLCSFAKPSFVLHATEAMHGDIGAVNSDDCLFFISNSGETKEIFPILTYCNTNNIKTFAITSSIKSTIAKKCDFNIVLPKFNELLPDLKPPIIASILTFSIGNLISLCICNLNNLSQEKYSQIHPNGKIGLSLITVSSYLESQKSQLRKSMNNAFVLSDSLLREAIKTLSFFNLGIIAITNKNGQLCGCFSDGDLKRMIEAQVDNKITIDFTNPITLQKFDNYITRTPKTINLRDSLFKIVDIVKDKKLSHLIVVDDDNKFIDILDSKDFFKIL